MNRKFIPAVAALLILGMLLTALPLSFAQTNLSQTYEIGPQLGVVTIPQDDQTLKTGVMILGIDPTYPASTTQGPADFMAQYKLSVTYNGEPLIWQAGVNNEYGPYINCNVLEKDKVNVVPDPKDGLGQQFPQEVLMTKLVDVSQNFICKLRWKSLGASWWESTGVLDVYYVGPTVDSTHLGFTTTPTVGINPAYFIADNILVVEAYFAVGKTIVWGSDLQDVCVLGWVPEVGSIDSPATPTLTFTKPDGTAHYIWADPMGGFTSCEAAALLEKQVLGIYPAPAQDFPAVV